jgi:hypothetical protein
MRPALIDWFEAPVLMRATAVPWVLSLRSVETNARYHVDP